MASSTATHADRKGNVHQDAGLPSLAAMSVNDTKTITGKKSTMAEVRKLCRGRQGKTFTYRRTTSRNQYVITRTK